jgi:hypothetical protein
MKIDQQMSRAVDALDAVTPMEWDALKSNDGTRYGHLAHPADKAVEEKVRRPMHYISDGVECIDYIRQQLGDEGFESYLEGNIIKYIHRFKRKGEPANDLRKARTYLDWLIKEVCLEGI